MGLFLGPSLNGSHARTIHIVNNVLASHWVSAGVTISTSHAFLSQR